jgi:hypothetical protein
MKQRIPSLEQFIYESKIYEAGGQESGKLELVQTSLQQALDYCEKT